MNAHDLLEKSLANHMMKKDNGLLSIGKTEVVGGSGSSTESSQSIVDELFKNFISKKISKTNRSTSALDAPKPYKVDEISRLLDLEISSIQAQTKESSGKDDVSKSSQTHRWEPSRQNKTEITSSTMSSLSSQNGSNEVDGHLSESVQNNVTANIPLLSNANEDTPPSSLVYGPFPVSSTSLPGLVITSSLSGRSSLLSAGQSSTTTTVFTTKSTSTATVSLTLTKGGMAKKMNIPKQLGCKLSTESLSLIKSKEKVDKTGRVWEDGEVASSHSEGSDKDQTDSEDDGFPSETGSIHSDREEWTSQNSSSSKHKKKHKHKHKKKKKKKSSREKGDRSKHGEEEKDRRKEKDRFKHGEEEEKDRKKEKDRSKHGEEERDKKKEKDRSKHGEEEKDRKKEKDRSKHGEEENDRKKEKDSSKHGEEENDRKKEKDRSKLSGDERDRRKEKDKYRTSFEEKDRKKGKNSSKLDEEESDRKTDRDRAGQKDGEKDKKSDSASSKQEDERGGNMEGDGKERLKDNQSTEDVVKTKGIGSGNDYDKDGKSSKSEARKRDKEKKRKSDRSRSRTPKRSRRSSRSRSPRNSRRSASPRRSRYGEWDARHYGPDTAKRSRSRSGSQGRSSKRKRSSERKREASKEHDKDLRVQIDKAKLRKIAIANALNSMKSGQMMPIQLDVAAVKSGGKSVEELTDFCKRISEKEQEKIDNAFSDTSEEEAAVPSDDEELPIHHPFKVKDTTSNIVMNIRNARQLPVLTPSEKQAQQATLRLAFPVSSGSHHRANESEWVPVERTTTPSSSYTSSKPASAMASSDSHKEPSNSIFPSFNETKNFMDIGAIISERLQAVRKLNDNPYDVQALSSMHKAQEKASQWAQSKHLPGQFVGSTGAQVMSQEQLMGDKRNQAWVRKSQFDTAAPVSGGIGMLLLQKMGWKQGEGLGKNCKGSLEPLKMDIKIDRKGLTTAGDHSRSKPQVFNVPKARDLSHKHPVSALMELCNKRHWSPPAFTTVSEDGPDHKKYFLFKVKVNNVEYQPAVPSSNKKSAKAQCAAVCLQEMGLLPKDAPMNY